METSSSSQSSLLKPGYSSSSLSTRIVDGIEEIFCYKCRNYRGRHEYAKDDTFIIQICSDCYAHDYSDEIQSLLELARLVEMVKENNITDEILVDLLGLDEYKKFKFLTNKYEL